MSGEKRQDEEVNLMTLPEAAKVAGYTPEYLNMLARSQKLQAIKIGRNWFTTQNWLDDFFHPEMKAARLAEEAAQAEVEMQKNTVVTESIFDTPESEEGKLQNFYFDETKEAARFEPSQNSVRWWRSKKVFSLAVVSILIFWGVAQVVRIKNNSQGSVGANAVAQLPTEIGKIENLDVTESAGVVLGEQTEDKGRILLASENFAIKEIKFGGDVSLLASSYENFALKLTDVRSQIVTTKNKDEMQLLVYWKTNKLGLSSIKYSKMGSDTGRTIKEDDFGFSHSVIIPGLDPATAYTYVITVKDKWNSTITSDRYSVYTGAKNVSVFDLIVKSAEDTFGWAMKK